MTTVLTVGAIAAALIYVIAVYNRLITLKNRFKNAFAQIDVQLQRRHDLIPNLVETAKAYMTHEQETLTHVIEARKQAEAARQDAAAHPDNNQALASLGKAESLLSGSLANFFAVSEKYPELKANATIAQLTEEMTSTENRIGFARQAFNDAVMNFNTYREQFPQNAISNRFGNFQHAEQLQIQSPQAREAVKVEF